MNVTAENVAEFEKTITAGGIAIFPTDTLYGIACDPDSAAAAQRIYELKGRPPVKPSAVMFFAVERLLAALPELDDRVARLIGELLPGPFTLVVPNPAQRFAPACADVPTKLGIRVPNLPDWHAPLREVRTPVLQTSANYSGGADGAALEDIDPAIRAGVDFVLDGGPLLGMGSTVADVSELAAGRWRLLRAPMPRTSGRLTELIGFPPSE